ncbi:unnamed protein product [Dovyalis caffra]|uniref:Uncharacterized protein n=1 Tax=Dovyalis caffra TaxID=77055 RepID=A0AAV1RNN3_9ROSI|nr:unnamed protein product [Dovyalis caffra]
MILSAPQKGSKRNSKSPLRDKILSPASFTIISSLTKRSMHFRDEDLNDNFFKDLSHVQQIHANCKVLLRTHHQRAGLELMDMMTIYQEGAYERLCKLGGVIWRLDGVVVDLGNDE